ncbi:hypothetical protein FHU41_001876 [Psychromicrobium silvestre]|uniref:Uncharacterized protein n=1 Tax=Psychromicrobium silvestre TaxID=1645614 RepID=A0A7Y9LU53_9MICC|nr:hypothetical protein [Psychromicrobium silvestre]NYE95626.1 hypothetical protein [Psychromicrobium silvestre]
MFRGLRRTANQRPALYFTLFGLAFALVYFLVGLVFGGKPISLAGQAVLSAFLWTAIWYSAHRKQRRNIALLAKDGRFQAAIRSPGAMKDSLSERWANGVVTPSAQGFGFQLEESGHELPAGPVTWYEVESWQPRHALTASRERGGTGFQLGEGSYLTNRGLRELRAAPEHLVALEKALTAAALPTTETGERHR